MPKKKNHTPPPAGSVFKARYEGREYSMNVTRENAELHYRVGKECFRSPSGAAKSITKREVNGWIFWGIVRNDR